MEALGGAASVIAVVDLSVKVTTLVFQYSKGVANARADVARLHSQAKSLDTTLQYAKRLVEGPDSPSLPASHDLADQFRGCQGELESLRAKIEPGTARKTMRRFGLRALKWPFSSKETETIIRTLERYQLNIMSGLQIDQT